MTSSLYITEQIKIVEHIARERFKDIQDLEARMETAAKYFVDNYAAKYYDEWVKQEEHEDMGEYFIKKYIGVKNGL